MASSSLDSVQTQNKKNRLPYRYVKKQRMMDAAFQTERAHPSEKAQLGNACPRLAKTNKQTKTRSLTRPVLFWDFLLPKNSMHNEVESRVVI